METSAIGWPPWLITFWYLLISEQLYMLMHEAMTWFLQIQRYQNGINQGGHPIALVSMATTLCETRLYGHLRTQHVDDFSATGEWAMLRKKLPTWTDKRWRTSPATNLLYTTLLLLLFASTKFCDFGIPMILRVLIFAISRSQGKFLRFRATKVKAQLWNPLA